MTREKDTYYFSHDSNARDDEKIVSMRIAHGWAGYGVYWAIVEMLRTSPGYTLTLDFDVLSFTLQAPFDLVRGVVLDFELFRIKDEKFSSESLTRRMKRVKSISDTRKKAAQKRWDSAHAMQKQSKCNANAMQDYAKERKVNERKVNKTKESYSENFEIFFKTHPGAGSKKKAFEAYKKVIKDGVSHEQLLAQIQLQENSRKAQTLAGDFVPPWKHVVTWLNGACWEDKLYQAKKLPPRREAAEAVVHMVDYEERPPDEQAAIDREREKFNKKWRGEE